MNDVPAPRISFDELAEIDLDMLDDVADGALHDHFLALAMQAGEGQLREVLNLSVEDDLVDHPALALAYATRRTEVALKLRALRAGS